mmetsp:Transcript_27013/g.42186  ORF Transcript_27013/g.42186 Transcript_27013/m.42186 type:complete len:82 (-) Transcript_27013:154-399(-)
MAQWGLGGQRNQGARGARTQADQRGQGGWRSQGTDSPSRTPLLANASPQTGRSPPSANKAMYTPSHRNPQGTTNEELNHLL